MRPEEDEGRFATDETWRILAARRPAMESLKVPASKDFRVGG